MRSNRKKFIGLFVVSIFFMLLLANAINLINDRQTNAVPQNLNSATSWTLEGIYIDGNATGVGAHNWSWVLEQPWCSIRDEKYVISNVLVTGIGSGVGIEIINPQEQFVIEDCTISYVETGISIYNSLEGVEIKNTVINNLYGSNGTNAIIDNGNYGKSGSDGSDATGLKISFSKSISISTSIFTYIYGGRGGNGGKGDDGVFLSPQGRYGGYGGYGGTASGIMFLNSTDISIHDIEISNITGGYGGIGGKGGNEYAFSGSLAGRGGKGRTGGMGIGINLINSTIDMMDDSEIFYIHGGNGGTGGVGGDVVGAAGTSGSGGTGGSGAPGAAFRLEYGYGTVKNTLWRENLFGGLGGKGGAAGVGSGGSVGYDGSDSYGQSYHFVQGTGGRIYEIIVWGTPDYQGLVVAIITIMVIIFGIIFLTGFIRGGSKIMDRRRESNARIQSYRAGSSSTWLPVKEIPIKKDISNNNLAVNEIPGNQDNLIEKAGMFYDAENHEYALNCIEDVLKQNPYSSEAWYKMGEILEKLGELEKGLECFQKAILYRNSN